MTHSPASTSASTSLTKALHTQSTAKALRTPPPLSPGDKVAIVSPSSSIDDTLIDAAVAGLTALGYNPVVMPRARGNSGSYAASHACRLQDMTAAMTDPTVKAILCSRGGYGAVHLLESLDSLPHEAYNKWIIGFSDISALHALWVKHGTVSIHGSMARSFVDGASSQRVKELDRLLRGGDTSITWETGLSSGNFDACGTLRGGNLAVLQALIDTPYDDLTPDGTILFIEDIAEPIYKVERMLMQLKLSGRLARYRAVIVGQFTDYRPDRNHASMEDMAAPILDAAGVSYTFGAPIGHIDDNRPVLHGAIATLENLDGTSTLRVCVNLNTL